VHQCWTRSVHEVWVGVQAPENTPTAAPGDEPAGQHVQHICRYLQQYSKAYTPTSANSSPPFLCACQAWFGPWPLPTWVSPETPLFSSPPCPPKCLPLRAAAACQTTPPPAADTDTQTHEYNRWQGAMEHTVCEIVCCSVPESSAASCRHRHTGDGTQTHMEYRRQGAMRPTVCGTVCCSWPESLMIKHVCNSRGVVQTQTCPQQSAVQRNLLPISDESQGTVGVSA
jgi:hypothetical protein